MCVGVRVGGMLASSTSCVSVRSDVECDITFCGLLVMESG